MHHCLRVTELLSEICEQAHEPNDPSDLLALALTCKAFRDPALDALYYEIRSLADLFMCLPRDLWDLRLVEIGLYCRNKYIPRVRVVRFNPASNIIFVDPHALSEVYSYCDDSLLPNLQELEIWDGDWTSDIIGDALLSDIIHFPQLIFGPSLTSVVLAFLKSNSLHILGIASRASPLLKYVALRVEEQLENGPATDKLLEVLRDATGRLHKLTSFSITLEHTLAIPVARLLEPIALFPALDQLHLGIQKLSPLIGSSELYPRVTSRTRELGIVLPPLFNNDPSTGAHPGSGNNDLQPSSPLTPIASDDDDIGLAINSDSDSDDDLPRFEYRRRPSSFDMDAPGKQPALTEGDLTPEMASRYQEACENYFMVKNVDAKNHPNYVFAGFLDHRFRTWYKNNKATLSILSLDDFFVQFRSRWLAKGWSRNLKRDITRLSQGDKSFDVWANEIRRMNSFLIGEPEHMDDKHLLSELSARMEKHLQDSVDTAKLAADIDIDDWIRAVALEETKLKGFIEAARSALSLHSSSSKPRTTRSSDDSTGSSNEKKKTKRQYSEDQLEALDGYERENLTEEDGCFKCRMPQAGHFAKECKLPAPDAKGYKKRTKDVVRELLAQANKTPKNRAPISSNAVAAVMPSVVFEEEDSDHGAQGASEQYLLITLQSPSFWEDLFFLTIASF
ncbi:hypothetical protein CONPUDRAFT_74179 [Coniophora puteana RWD-64-598 SS2]|uniref:Retrotransposon gag domain-containing protein n=1 Tax=Coniophora puteana (strain RWD-64-598) TaxID=741705 RepID=A0A5M3MLD8_CONPW|nr:uncharacterized protein CONPUDRAFT_74179 [Coniophora puteana RWD-64-598 SS2]EIW79847.1 hypothetical protein CONPUDRAFT_74179 [Coniophora puteana RWD-64-598 SS2]